MLRTATRWFATLLSVCLAAALGSGCFGVSQNPSYFPFLLPTGDVVRTHAKPPGRGYFSNFDPFACRLEVRPLEDTNPVRTQHVLIATVYDGSGQPRRARRVEWLLEGVGNIIEVDESGYFPGRGYKVNNQYAVSYTDLTEHTITRGNSDPNDDFTIRPGQSWCVISSAVEGDTHVTVYCPEIYDWDNHKVFVTKHWVDAEWVFPKPAVNRAGTTHVFTTNIRRHTDKQPLAGYRVRYRVLDGPPAFFAPMRTQEAVVESDLQGNAHVTLAQVAPVLGVNRVGVEIIRPPDPCAPSGVGIVIGRGVTSKEWQAPQVTLTKTAPAQVPVGAEVPYTITVTNGGPVESRALTVRDVIPDGLKYLRSDPPAIVEQNQLIWTLGELPGGQSRTIQVVFESTRVGQVRNTAVVTTDEGLKDERTITTEITAPQLKVVKTGPATGVMGVPIPYEVTVTNPGSGTATNVVLRDAFDPGLEHESKANPIELPVGSLAAGQSKTVKLSLIPRKNGVLVNRVTATGDGNLKAEAQHPVTVQEAKLLLKKTGPTARYVGRPAQWDLLVTNPGDVPLNGVVVRDQLPPELDFESATEGGQHNNKLVTWTLGTLQPNQQKLVQVRTKCKEMTRQAVNVAVATADPGLEVRDQAPIEIRGLPAFRLEVQDTDDPVEVGGQTTYEIVVKNQGSLPGENVQMTCLVPPQMQVVNATGPTQPQVDRGGKVTYPPVESLPPNADLRYTINVKAVQQGDVRFQAELRSGTLGDPVIEQESTNIYAPMAGTPPAGGAPAPGPAAPPPPTSPGGPGMVAAPRLEGVTPAAFTTPQTTSSARPPSPTSAAARPATGAGRPIATSRENSQPSPPPPPTPVSGVPPLLPVPSGATGSR